MKSAPTPRGILSRCPGLRWLLLPLFVLLALPSAARAQLVVYSFGSSAAPVTTATTVGEHLAASVFSGSAGSPTTGAGAPLFAAGSGGSYFSASGWTGAAPGTNYFAFTLTPAAGYEFEASDVSFAYRATSSGPASFAIRSSLDAFASDLASGSFLTDSTWHSSGAIALGLAGLDAATTFRLYGAGASSALGTLRVDDFSLSGNISAVPEPSTWAAIAGGGALAVALLRRRRARQA